MSFYVPAQATPTKIKSNSYRKYSSCMNTLMLLKILFKCIPKAEIEGYSRGTSKNAKFIYVWHIQSFI